MATTYIENIDNLRPDSWTKKTVADGPTLTNSFLNPTHEKDQILARGIDTINSKLSTYDTKISNVNTRLDTVNENIDLVNADIADVENKLDEIEHETSAKLEKVYVNEQQLSGDGTQNNPIGIINGGGGGGTPPSIEGNMGVSAVYIPEQNQYIIGLSGTKNLVFESSADTIVFGSSAAGKYNFEVNPELVNKWNAGTSAFTNNGFSGIGTSSSRIGVDETGMSTSYKYGWNPQLHKWSEINEGGGTSDVCWYPTISETGELSWQRSTSTVEPTPVNIIGPDGYSPTVEIEGITGEDNRTGNKITFHYGENLSNTTSYSAWDGLDGQGATVNLFGDKGIEVIPQAGSTNYIIGLSGGYYAPTLSAGSADKAGYSELAGSATYAEKFKIDNTDYTFSNLYSEVDTLSNASGRWDAHSALSATKLDKSIWDNNSGKFVTSAETDFPNVGQYGIIKDTNGIHWGEIQGGGGTYDFDNNTQGYHTLSGDGSTNPIGVNTDLFYKKTETSGKNQLSIEFATKVDKPNSADSSVQDKYLALRTKADGTVSGWTDILDKVYSKTEVNNTFVQKTTVKTGTYGNVTAVSAIGDVPIKDTNLWAVTGTYENNNNYQHYIENTNTFNYYTVMVHPANTSSAAGWANDNIIHIILE